MLSLQIIYIFIESIKSEQPIDLRWSIMSPSLLKLISRISVAIVIVAILSASTLFAEDLKIIIKSNKSEYAVGEPVKMAVKFRNESDSTIRIIDVREYVMTENHHLYYKVINPKGELKVRKGYMVNELCV